MERGLKKMYDKKSMEKILKKRGYKKSPFDASGDYRKKIGEKTITVGFYGKFAKIKKPMVSKHVEPYTLERELEKLEK